MVTEFIDWRYSIAGAFTGFTVGLTGVGGGALMTPILLLVFRLNPVTAVATDLWFAALTKLIAARVHQQSHEVDWQVLRRLWWGSIPVSLVVVAAIYFGTHTQKVEWLTRAIGLAVGVAAIGMFLAPKLSAFARARRIGAPARFKAVQPHLTVVAGGVLGLLVALTSVGAGALGSVMLLMLYPLRMTPHRLVGTDIVHAIPLAAVAGTGYLFAGLVDFHLLASLLAGSVPAAWLGAMAARKTHPKWLRILLGSILVATSVKLVAG
ncbi:MAG: TSUP family transporter [Betaproteobacteria bacterium]|nr:TSUP family transporter [Betaproteobacteria bacterium]